MTTFEDGPAAGQHLFLKRAPIFLRVAEARGKWDALDQLEDKPLPHEKLYAYRIVGEAGTCFVSSRGRGGLSGVYAAATYRFIAEQPTDEEMRDAITWRQWCLAHQP